MFKRRSLILVGCLTALVLAAGLPVTVVAVTGGEGSPQNAMVTPASLALAEAELAKIIPLLEAQGIDVADSRVEGGTGELGDLQFYSIDVPSQGWDSDLRNRVTAYRVMSLAKATGEITGGYANVAVVYEDGTTDPLRMEIPPINLERCAPVSQTEASTAQTVLTPRIKELASKAGLTVNSASVTTEAETAVLAVDLTMPAESNVESLSEFAEQLWALARDPATHVGIGCLRVFDDSGEQLVSEVQDFALSMGMSHADIQYPAQ